MIGAAVSGLCLLTLGFTKEIVAFFISDEATAKSLTVFTAVLAIYAVDFAVNVGSLYLPTYTRYLAVDSVTDSTFSHVCGKESSCRYTSNIEATDGLCLG